MATASADGAPYLVPLSLTGTARCCCDALPGEQGDRFAARTGFDPRSLDTPYPWYRVAPRRIQAWCEVDELPDRELMRDGHWSV